MFDEAMKKSDLATKPAEEDRVLIDLLKEQLQVAEQAIKSHTFQLDKARRVARGCAAGLEAMAQEDYEATESPMPSERPY